MVDDFFSRYSIDSNLLLQALDSVQEGITLIDRNGYVRYANAAACSIMGVERNELMDKKVDRFSKNTPLLIKIIDEKESIIDVEYFLDFKGRTIHLINSGYPAFNEKGEIIGAIDIFRSIQRSRKLANSIVGYPALFTFDQIIGENNKIKEAIKLAKAFSKNDNNILIIGESGTGKELFAQSIHNYSHRRTQPFIALNCANFPADLIDSELFGYEEGAFTGALKGGKPGKFEAANDGTLFFDEIGEMPIHLQPKLLRVIETNFINRIGSHKPIHVNAKIIAATNRKLEDFLEEGRFREDLYYRLKVLFLEIPPLRDRGDDVLLLTEYFIKKLGAKMNKRIKGLDDEAQKILLQHTWPGNVRELENTIARSLFINEGSYITGDNLRIAGLKEHQQQNDVGVIKSKTHLQRELVLDIIRQTGGNKRRAAEMLRISRPTLYKLLKKYEYRESM